ncbi:MULTISPECIES: hypothetical protein [unclassified Aeromonas]|uniref:hypothetical protein n=1 Tax=unclassified Aeromonas TaxID=257493 RepID=UPI00084B7FCA|nr:MULTISPECIES: hypothetical protein [unclassified Aeromonas]OEC49121.1 hypothetical protein A9G04_21050 [Aeromonas sp. ANNP30]OEC60260.1 hypothetical protein A9G49_21515 [Aeromonas sp. ANP5]
MRPEEFVNALKKVVTKSSVDGVESMLMSPPGRKPKKEILLASKFYNERTEEEKKIIMDIVKLSVDNGVFGFLCVLDGVRAVENEDSKGEFILIHRKQEDVILNEDSDLHDYYNAT